MSELKVKKVSDRAGTGAPDFTYGLNVSGVDSGISPFTHTEGETEPSSPSNGDTWWDSANELYYVYVNDEWTAWIGTPASSAVNYGDRAFSVGYLNGANSIDYWDMTTSGNASDFGDLVRNVADQACGSSSTNIFVTSTANAVMVFTSATLGNATDHCDMNSRTSGTKNTMQTDGSIGVIAFGNDGTTSRSNSIDKFSTASTSASTDFGDRSVSTDYLASMANSTRCVLGGGRLSSGTSNVIDYVTFSTTGNATDFGDLTVARFGFGGAGGGEGDRGVWMGGSGGDGNVIDYITISTTGNATDFGNMIEQTNLHGVCNNATKGHASGGYGNVSSFTDKIEEITLATTGNASDFGDLTVARYQSQSASGAAS